MAGVVVVVGVVVTWAMALLRSVLSFIYRIREYNGECQIDILARVGASYFCDNG